MALLTASDYQAARRLVDTQLTTTDLPDTVIAEIIYHGAAEAWILRRDPSAASRTGDELSAVRRATLYWLASLLAPAAFKLTSVSVRTTDLAYTRPGFKASDRVRELRKLAEEELSGVSGVTPDPDYAIRKPVKIRAM